MAFNYSYANAKNFAQTEKLKLTQKMYYLKLTQKMYYLL